MGDNGGWISPAGTMSIKSDATAGIGKYQTVVSGKSGTCRSGYVEIPAVKENFVFECDYRTTSNVNVSDLELLESKSSVYANHGKYSNAKYAFTMVRPSQENLYVINNPIDDSGLTLDRYAHPAVTTAEIADHPWLHVKVVGNYDTHTVITYITSLDGKKTYYHGMTDMSPDISSFQCIHLLSPSTGADTCIDNIRVMAALPGDLAETFYRVTLNDGVSEFSQYVYTGEHVRYIPDMSRYGEYFLGWNVNGEIKTTAELEALPVTGDAQITAQISEEYKEKLVSVEFNSFPADHLLTMGPDVDTYADNLISLSITGERGTSFVVNPDERVTDYAIQWKFDGFRIMDGRPTGETGNVYCDSYGLCEVTEKAQTSVNFKLKNTAANYYGRVTATVTYNGKTMSVSEPLLLLADTGRDTSVMLPKAGYASDYNWYDGALVGYQASQKNDVLTGGWSADGSDQSNIVVSSDAQSGQYLSLTRNVTGNSSYIYQTIGDISGQTLFSQDIRFGMDTVGIAYGNGKSSSVTDNFAPAFEVTFADSKLSLNGQELCAANQGIWYHIEVTADPTTRLCFAKVYEKRADGDYTQAAPLGESSVTGFKDGYTNGAHYRITLGTRKTKAPVDINNVRVVAEQVDASTVSVTAEPETIAIPESGTQTATLTLSAKMAGGGDALGRASWVIDDEMAEGVAIASKDAKSALLTVDGSALPGELPIKVTINHTTVQAKVRLTGTKNHVAFTSAQSGIMLPANGSVTYPYTAEVRDGNGDKIEGKTVSYALYNADNTEELTAEGISVSADGVITVTAEAKPQTICVRAFSQDLVRSVRVTIYGLKFDFGTDAAKDGYTQVLSDVTYSERRGYGVTGTAEDAADVLSGADFGFRVKLAPGEVYKVTAAYQGTIRCEYIDAALSGFERTKDTLSNDTYQTAVFGDGVLDITLSGAGKLDSIAIEKAERSANEKPAWWTIGDSTVQQNGSWAYTLYNTLANYSELNGAISSFHNSGQAGRQHKSYYTEGLLNNVLCGIRPGDVVSISGMGTNDSASTKQQFRSYTESYIDAIEAMGAYVILGSYTPTGNYGATMGKVYDSDRVMFKGMRTNAYDAAIREVYAQRTAAGDEKVLGFIDIGKIADHLMTNDVRKAYNMVIVAGKSEAEARAAADARAAELMAMWKDYNHYYTEFSNYLLPTLTAQAAQLITGQPQDDVPELTELLPEGAAPDFIEVESADEYVDVSSLTMYGSATYRMYRQNGGYETVTAGEDGTVHNTTGGKVTIVPAYRFEFTNQQNPTDPYLKGYVKVTAKNSYNASVGYGLANAEYSVNENGCKPVAGAPIKVDVPAGYYDITVYRRGGARADVYSEGVQIINNTNSAGSQNRPSGSAVMYAPGIFVENGNVDLTFGNTSGNNERIASVEIVRVPRKFRKPVIWVAGDSESAHYYPINADGDDLLSQKIMMTGFGMQLEKYLSDKYSIANWGQPSATAGTWNTECLAAVTQRMQKGDTILIDFGINDAVSSSNKVDVATAKANIKAIVDAAKSKGVTPILITPVYNAKYQHKTYFTYNKETDSNALKEFAREIGVSCFDLNKYTMLYTQQAVTETGDANWIANNYHVADNLHMTQHSALLDASFICAALKKLGYETTDYAYTYHDLSSLQKASESDTAATLRGEESGVTRVYSVAEAEKFIAANASPEEIYTKMWNFDTNQTAADGLNVPVISGTAVWDETYQNIKFPADTKETGELRVALVPAASGNTIRVSFDLYVGMLGNQRFSYEIMDNEGTSLVNCSFEKRSSGSNGTLVIAGQSVGDSDAIAAAIQAKSGNPMNNPVTQMINEFNFDERTVKVTIGSTVFTGALTGAETATVSAIQMKAVRSATNGERHIHLDNLSVKGYEIAGAGGDTQTRFPDFETGTYTGDDGAALPYRIAKPQSVQGSLPVVVFLHGETRKGTDNESQLYNAQHLYQAIREAGIDCIFVAPQCPQNRTWADMAAAVKELAGQIEGADSDKIYAAGYGEGGSACYDLLGTGVFAAAVPIAAAGDATKAQAIAAANAAVLAINGSNEAENARDMIKALLTAGDTCAEYSEIYGAGSGILEQAAKTGVVEWLFAKSLSENAKKTTRKVDLAIFMGQSNMAGRGEYADATACPAGHGYEFRSVTEPGMLFSLSGPFGKLENNDTVNDNGSDGIDRRSGDMVSALMESYYQQTKTPLVGVQCSRGGTDLNYWNKAAQKAEAQARLTAAKSYLEKNGYEIGHVFMVWVQGEADADKVFKGSETLDAYKSGTLGVFQYMKEAGVTDMFIVQTGHYNGTDADAAAHDEAYVKVHDAQAELAAENQNVYTVGSLLEYKDSMKDQYHYHQDAYNEVGTAAGAAIAQAYAQ